MGYYGVGNLGDEMMLVCLKPWLERQGFELTVLSEKPAAVSKAHGLPAVENSPLLGEWAWRSSWLEGGASRVSMLVPGRADVIMQTALALGFRIEVPLVLMASRPFGNWRNYVPRDPGFM
jgi:hypothetical protein